MTYLININQLVQLLPRIVYAPLHRPHRYSPGGRDLVERVASGEVNEGLHRHRAAFHLTDYGKYLIHPRQLVGLHTASLIPFSQSLRVHHTQSALRVQPQVAHDGPAPCKQRTAVVSVPCLECLHHRVGGEVVRTLIVVVVAPRYAYQREIHRHEFILKVHG